MQKKISFLIVCMMLATTFSGIFYIKMSIANPTIINVHPGESIQNAINTANPGDTVFVYNGSYQEQINVTNSVVLEGQNNSGTIVVGGFNVTENNTTIRNFKITSGYEWDPDGAGINGMYRAGIYASSINNYFSYNNINDITGGAGVHAEDGKGGLGVGIYLSFSAFDVITHNSISGITGGLGGGGDVNVGGIGGIGAGIYLQSSNNINISSNTFSQIFGGEGGGVYGDGGIGTGVYINISNNCSVTVNIFSTITGGTGAASRGSGYGGDGFGIYLRYSSSNTIISNIFSNIIGGRDPYGGGIAGSGVAIFLTSSTLNNINLNTIQNILGTQGAIGMTGGKGGAGVGIYLISSTLNNINLNIIQNILGGNGGDSLMVLGGDGGLGAGVYLSYSSSNILSQNSIHYIFGGNGNWDAGDGAYASGIILESSSNCCLSQNIVNNIFGGDGRNGSRVVHWGGSGGSGTGIYMQNTTYTTITQNIVSNCTGGIGGTSEEGEPNGADGIGFSITLNSSSGNLCYNNYFNNTNNAYDDGNNKWNISKTLGTNIIGGPYLGGNYWDDYTGSDSDNNFIGDTPYNISGGDNKDYLPLVKPWSNHPPIITNPNPANESTGVIRPPIQLNATVEDPNSDVLTLTLRWMNHTGKWVTLITYHDVNNGTYGYVPSGNDWIWGNTTYFWSANVTDEASWTNETYQYTTNGSRYDVNNNNIVNFQDAGLVWVHRISLVPYDGLYDVNQDGQVNFQDAGLTWVHRD